MAGRSGGTTLQDRQRDRAARGIGTKSATRFATDRPSAPRRRRPALAALAVLLIAGGAALAGLLALRLDSREPVVVLTQNVPAGTEITADVLGTADVASDGLRLVPVDQVDEVIGTFTSVPIAQGQLLETAMLTTAAPFGAGLVQIGIPLESGKAPSGLRSGDLVRLVRLGDGGSTPAQPIATALVISTSADEKGGSLGSGGDILREATLLVPVRAADLAVDSAANEKLGIALADRGVTVDDADLVVLGAR